MGWEVFGGVRAKSLLVLQSHTMHTNASEIMLFTGCVRFA